MSIAHFSTTAKPTFNTPRPANAWGILMLWMARAKQRRQLAQLDADRLDDMGITPAEAAAEAAKPFWQE